MNTNTIPTSTSKQIVEIMDIPAIIETKSMQTTLTQAMDFNPRQLEYESDSYSDFETTPFPKKKSEAREINDEKKRKKIKRSESGVTVHRWSLTSMVDGYGLNYDDPQPGDVVMGRAGDLNHPTFLGNEISRNYYVMGVVRGFCYIREEFKYVKKNCYGDEDCNERLEVAWIKVKNGKNDRAFAPPHKKQVHVIAKGTDPNLVGMNDYIIEQVKDNLFFAKSFGWMPWKP